MQPRRRQYNSQRRILLLRQQLRIAHNPPHMRQVMCTITCHLLLQKLDKTRFPFVPVHARNCSIKQSRRRQIAATLHATLISSPLTDTTDSPCFVLP